MQTCLPQELRDIVYAFLGDTNTRNAAQGFRVVMRRAPNPEADRLHPYDYHGLPHFLSPHYVGRQTACEVAQSCI
jgi:hypothetical protein